MPISSIAKSEAAAPMGRCSVVWLRFAMPRRNRPGSIGRAGLVLAEVVDLDRARLDVGRGLVDGGLHFRRDQLGVVVVKRCPDAIFGKTEDNQTRGPLAVLLVVHG